MNLITYANDLKNYELLKEFANAVLKSMTDTAQDIQVGNENQITKVNKKADGMFNAHQVVQPLLLLQTICLAIRPNLQRYFDLPVMSTR